MNKDEEIKQVILNLLKTVDKGVQFTSEQMPLVLEEVLRYNLMISCIYVWMWLCLLSFTIYMIYITRKDEDNFHKALIIGFIPVFVSILGLLSNIDDIVKIAIVPRVFLLEYLKHLV